MQPLFLAAPSALLATGPANIRSRIGLRPWPKAASAATVSKHRVEDGSLDPRSGHSRARSTCSPQLGVQGVIGLLGLNSSQIGGPSCKARAPAQVDNPPRRPLNLAQPPARWTASSPARARSATSSAR